MRAIPPAGAERSREVPALGSESDLVVRVLGPVEITGWAQVPTERRSVLEGLCAYLALHAERPRATDELVVALGLDDVDPKTLRNNLSRLRRLVGPERLPDAVASGGYQLAGAVTDWDQFSALLDDAKAADGARADELVAEALAHVRGVPFGGAPADHFAWALDSGLAQQMTAAVAKAAHGLATRRLEAGDPVGATEAARLGQRVSRDDFDLWSDLFAAARMAGDAGSLRRLRAEARRVLEAELADALFEGRTPFAR